MRLTFLFLCLFLTSACSSDSPEGPLSPEAAFLSSLPQGSAVQILGKEDGGITAILYFRGSIAPNPETNTPALVDVQGVVFMEDDGQRWKASYSTYGKPEERLNPNRFISHHLHKLIGQRGNTLQMVEGSVFDASIASLQIRLGNGRTVIVNPVGGLYATVVADEVGICAILALDANGLLKQEITIPDNPNCH